MIYLKYLKYILKHKWYVFLECCKLGIPLRGLLHDISKLRPSEFFPYAKYFYGYKFPNDQWYGDKRNFIKWEWTEKGIKEAFDKAWLLHQKRNPHHWQYWLLINDSSNNELQYKHQEMGTNYIRDRLNKSPQVIEMPLKYAKEMLADWKGAGKAITGKDDTKGWYNKNKDNIIIHPDVRAYIERNI